MMIGYAVNIALLTFVIGVLSIGAVYYEEGYTVQEVENVTSSINWNETTFNPNAAPLEGSVNGSLGLRTQTRLQNIIEKTVDWLGFTMFEVAKWGVEYGYTHPEYNYQAFFNLLKTLIIFGIAYYAFYPVLFLGFGGLKLYEIIRKKVKE